MAIHQTFFLSDPYRGSDLDKAILELFLFFLLTRKTEKVQRSPFQHAVVLGTIRSEFIEEL